MGVAAGLRPAHLVEVVTRIAKDIASLHAVEVDREGRFPHETIDALREAGVLGALVPGVFEPGGVSIADMARAIEALGAACASAGMILAMHQIQVVCLLQHRRTPWIDQFIDEVVAKGGLLASVTSEGGVGGNARASRCSLVDHGTHLTIDKDAPFISYGEQADAFLVTARRTEASGEADQIMAIVPAGPEVLTRVRTWNAFGYRGTCSHAFRFHADVHPDQVVPEPFADVFTDSMHPSSHVFWTSLWLGMATGAMRTARAYVRTQARANGGEVPPVAHRFALAMAKLDTLRQLVREATDDYDRRSRDPDRADTLGYSIKINNLKLAGSALLLEVVQEAFFVCGMAAYGQDSAYTLGRTLRDAYGAIIQINNERIIATNAHALLLSSGGLDGDV